MAFDESVGLGKIRADDGSEIGFQCTQIADGTRTITVGAEVDFEVIPGRHGRWEAGGLRGSGA